MSRNNRGPRSGQMKDDADEERNIWNQIIGDGRKIDGLIAKSNELCKRMVELKDELDAAIADGTPLNTSSEDELESVTRENVRLHEKIVAMLEGESDGNNLSTLNGLEVLGALRTSSEADQAANNTSRNASGKSQRSRGPKRESARESARESTRESAATSVAEDRDSVVGDSPGDPSPKVGPSTTASRLIGKAGSRQGSVPAGREASVKADDGAESADGVKVSASERNKLQVGTEVCYKNKAKAAEGEGILCSITNVVGEGKQRRYEIIDSDTDTPTPPTPYRASVNYLVPIPSSNLGLPDLAPGKTVLALYPNTTTFYRAEVVASKNKKDGPAELKEGFVRLRFEGEEEVGRNEDVERRYVLVA